MTISARLELSHSYSFDAPIRAVFRLTLVPEKLISARGFHYVVVIDISGSMTGEKLDLARRGAEEYVRKIPNGNYLSFLTFSDNVRVLKEFSASISLSDCLPMITAGGETKLYSALRTVFELAERREIPGWIVLLTDGEPTDVTQPTAYKALRIPKGFEMIEFGIGSTYMEDLLKALAESSGGKLFHITDPAQLPTSMESNAVNEVAAKNLTVEYTGQSPLRLLNYPGPPTNINAVANSVKIWGDVMIPTKFSGQVLGLKISYEDTTDGTVKRLDLLASVDCALDKEKFIGGVRPSLVSEYSYYQSLQKYYEDLASGNIRRAERTMKLLTASAEQTRRGDLVDVTRRLSENLEQTRKLGGSIEMTRNLSKEAASEVTRKSKGS